MLSDSQFPAGRFAPSPTGPFHLGSLIAALGSYLLARTTSRRWLLRIDDLDRPRVVKGAADGIMSLLEELGFQWDKTPLWQSQRTQRYVEVLQCLKEKGLVYPCSCSRKEVLASAPHRGEEGPIYPGTCREGLVSQRSQSAWRLRVDGAAISFLDGLRGAQSQDVQHEVGDFVLFRADGLFAYQLATVIDDFDSGVDQVVRGGDLLTSTARQIFLYHCLQSAPPQYLHLPLVLGADGEKLSKRHGNSGMVRRENSTEMMALALRFLGQSLPLGLRGAPAAEQLSWALKAFDPSLLRAEDMALSALRG
ncbi:MAG: tRNA glutamyl-Q(34) synthetase GluQRS [Geopsychrobacter sp.]|nr:tRNA glutamyl-Q(34) synthetase GluQRS [Geopsychrobacter sp.]